MNDAEFRALLEQLEAAPLAAHPKVLEDVRQRIESELEDLRRRLPSSGDGHRDAAPRY